MSNAGRPLERALIDMGRQCVEAEEKCERLESENARLRSQLSALREALRRARFELTARCYQFELADLVAPIDAALASTEPGGEEKEKR